MSFPAGISNLIGSYTHGAKTGRYDLKVGNYTIPGTFTVYEKNGLSEGLIIKYFDSGIIEFIIHTHEGSSVGPLYAYNPSWKQAYD